MVNRRFYVDIYPTLLGAARIEVDTSQTLDGVSILPTWTDASAPIEREALYWHYPLDQPHFLGGRSSGAIRQGDWKLIEFFDTGEVELYSLAANCSEGQNVAAKHPDTASKLQTTLAQWRQSIR